jgi:hypothetical protein
MISGGFRYGSTRGMGLALVKARYMTRSAADVVHLDAALTA